MRILEVEQGTPEWLAVKRGIPSASCFHHILTPAKLGASASAFKYMCRLIVERVLGVNVGDDASQFMQRGTALEQEAVSFYEFTHDVEARPVGFCLHDALEVGCSPDRLVGDDGLLEIKVPSAEVHVGYLLRGVENEYRLQTQGQLWVTGRAWVDLCSYNPEFPPALVRCYPDAEVFEALDAAMPVFVEQLDEATERVRAMGAVSKDGRGAEAVAEEATAPVRATA